MPQEDAGVRLSDTAFDLLPLGVIIIDARNFRVLAANRAIAELPSAPWRGMAVVGIRLWDLPRHPEITRFAAACRRVRKTGGSFVERAVPFGDPAHPTYWDLSLLPICAAGGVVTQLLATITDVTAEVTLHAALERGNRDLQRQNEDLATLSHLAVETTTIDQFTALCQHALTMLLDLFSLTNGSVALLDADHATTTVIAYSSVSGNDDWQHACIPTADYPMYTALAARMAPLVIPDGIAPPYASACTGAAVGCATRSLLIVPVIVRGELIGAIMLEATATDRAWTEGEVSLAERVAGLVSVAMQNARQAEELRRRADDLEVLNAMGRAVSESLDLPTVLDRVLASLRAVVQFDRASVAIIEPDGAHLRVVSDTATEGNQEGELVPVAGSLRGYVFTSRQPLAIGDSHTDALPLPARLPRAAYPRNIILVPLFVGERATGILSVLSDTPATLRAGDVPRLERVAAQVAVAVTNAQLYAQVQQRLSELRLLNADLAEANRHKSVFLATMSHELRTPLNAIIGFSELLADEMIVEPEDRRQALADIQRSGEHLLSLINDVLDLVKVEAGQLTLKMRAVLLHEELMSVQRVMSALFARRTQHFTVAIPDDLPPIVVDPDRLRQIVINLLSNANKFTPEGGTVTLAARAVGDAVEIRVTDTGIGIKPDDAALIWQEFRQVDSAMNRRYEGTGLGLALVQRMVTLMHGRVWVESEPDKGATFFVAFPGVADARENAATAAAQGCA